MWEPNILRYHAILCCSHAILYHSHVILYFVLTQYCFVPTQYISFLRNIFRSNAYYIVPTQYSLLQHNIIMFSCNNISFLRNINIFRSHTIFYRFHTLYFVPIFLRPCPSLAMPYLPTFLGFLHSK